MVCILRISIACEVILLEHGYDMAFAIVASYYIIVTDTYLMAGAYSAQWYRLPGNVKEGIHSGDDLIDIVATIAII